MDIPARYAEMARGTRAFAALNAARESDRMSHAYLLASPDDLLSVCVAVALACASACARGGCLTCPVCKRILSGRCGDVRVFGEDGLTTADADEAVALSLVTPGELDKRWSVVMMTDANEAAQNKLLKTLEEPPETDVFFVITRDRAAVLPTIASRCEELSPRLPEGALRRMEGGMSPYLDYALYAGGDSLTEFDELLGGAGVGDLTAAIRLVRAAGSGDVAGAAFALPSSREDAANVLKYVERILGDVIRAHAGMAPDTRGLYDMDELTKAYPLAALPEALSAVRRAVSRVPSGNMASVADALAITITEVTEKCRRL